jgi:hypothetical protein
MSIVASSLRITGCTIQRMYFHLVKKVKLPPCIIVRLYAMKACGGVDVYIHIFLTSALLEVSCQIHTPAAKEPPVLIEWESGYAPEPV